MFLVQYLARIDQALGAQSRASLFPTNCQQHHEKSCKSPFVNSIEIAIKKYGACEHGITPYESKRSARSAPVCLLCRKDIKTRWSNSDYGQELRNCTAQRRRCLEFGSYGSHTPEEWIQRCKYWGYRCPICGLLLTNRRKKPNTASKDHMIPLAWGGANDAQNLIPMCLLCNIAKNNRYALFEYPIDSKHLIAVYR
jgi:HNH endonuclease